MKKKEWVFIIVISCLPAALQAQQKQESDERALVGGTFMRLDMNSDGKIDQAEAQADSDFVGRFREFDLNRDGVITAEEMQQYDEAAKKGRIDRANKKSPPQEGNQQQESNK